MESCQKSRELLFKGVRGPLDSTFFRLVRPVGSVLKNKCGGGRTMQKTAL